MVIDEINKRLEYINNKIKESSCIFSVINDKKNNIHKIEIKTKDGKSILQSYEFQNQKHILEFLTSYQLIDTYIQFINSNFRVGGII